MTNATDKNYKYFELLLLSSPKPQIYWLAKKTKKQNSIYKQKGSP